MSIKKIAFVLAGLLPLAVTAQSGYTINGQISGLKEPAKVYLVTMRENAWKDTDSTMLKNGKFQFTGRINNPMQVAIRVSRINTPEGKSGPDMLDFFLENSKITVTAVDSIKKATINGSVAEREHQELESRIRPLSNTISKIYDRFRNRPRDPQKPIEDDRKKAGDSVVNLIAQIKDLQWKFAESHTNSFMGMYVYNMDVLDSKFDPVKAEPLLHRFSAELQASELGKNSLDKIAKAKRRQEGVKATDFTQNDLNGKPFTLSSLRGKYVLVDFWASWCGPCRAESPHLVKAYQELKDKNFEVVGVSLDQSKASWEDAVKADKLPWIQVCDFKGWKNDVGILYGISSVPQNILINPEGMIVGTNLRGEGLTEKLRALMK